MINHPSDVIFVEAMELSKRARKLAINAAYGQIVLSLLYDERSSHGWFEFNLKALDIRRQINRELKAASRLNNAAEETLRRAQRLRLKEVEDGRRERDA